MPREHIVLGIDLATANARVLAVGIETGTTLAEARTALPAPQRPRQGWSEQVPDYGPVVLRLLKEVAGNLGALAADVRALSITGTSGTVVPSDSRGRPVGNALMYDDQRAAREAIEIAALGPMGPSASLARVAWLEGNAPAEKYLTTPGTVQASLAGYILAGDTSHSLKSAIDLESGIWDQRLLEELRLPNEKMGDLVQPGTTVGEVSARQAAELGLPDGVQIIAGMTDGCTAQIGAGAIRDGDVVGVLGTTLVLKSVAAMNVASPDFVVYSHRGPDGSYWPGGASNVGAGVLSRGFGDLGGSLEGRNDVAGQYGVAKAISYPLNGRGERFPFESSSAEFFCLGGDNSSVDNHRAIMEGVAFTERLGVERLMALGVAPRRFLATGGGSSSAVWNTIRASVLGHPVHRPESHNSAFGAAMIAAAAITAEQLADVSDRMVSINGTFEPDPAQGPGLEDNYQRFVAELQGRGYLDAGSGVLPGSGTGTNPLDPHPHEGARR